MRESGSLPLLAGAAVALLTVALARQAPAAAAAFAAAGTGAAVRGRGGSAGLAALPVLLAALPPPAGAAPPPPAGPVRLAGTVVDVRRDPASDDCELELQTGGGRLWLHATGTDAILYGDRVEAVARCSPPAVPGGPVVLRAAAEAIAHTPGRASLPRLCAAARRALEDELRALVPGPSASLLVTLVLGTGTRLPGAVAAAHRATGLSHLLAVSGAHAAMLAWILGLQPFGPGRRRRVGRAHMTFGLLVLAAYGAVTGLEPPVFRALCSYALVALGIRSGRRVGLAAALAWPAMLSCLLAPDRVLGASFCLSYAAVAGLALAGGPHEDGAFQRWVATPVRASFWATVTTAPLTLAWFGQLAPWTVLLTPLLAPVVAALLFLGLGAALCGLAVPPLGAALAVPLERLAAAYEAAVVAADGLPGTPVHALANPPLLLLVAGFLAALLAVAARPSRGHVLLAALLASAAHFVPPAPEPPARLWLLAVGHGQACLSVLADGSNVLVDCGSLQQPQLPSRKVERILRRRCIDLLVLTHGDRDHTGAVADLLARLPVRAAVLPEALRGSRVGEELRGHGAAVVWLPAGRRVRPHPAVLVAAPRPSGNANDDSLWVRLAVGGLGVLLTGDAEEAGVAAALGGRLATHADVLVLPHHGRANAAAGALLAAVAPRLCLCSNRHGEGLSAQGLLAMARGIPTFATGVAGDLQLLGGSPPILLAPGFALADPRPARGAPDDGGGR